ncbi:hypothetical protein [Hymenobacter sp. GOD-10R]|uniref:hypothetical protein n=1 Tax=Hymenobacter sp. GOD-10R TaxID=3093922 RepID=UPI002D77E414|nr:hypothetical protein [Hymenobacter sp. GOD-10R]WRQ29964.1 hypothetical protein SD425_06750 [Hymenobacter sp. GOD-10R]
MKDLKQRITDKAVISLWLVACVAIIILAIPFIPLILIYAYVSDKQFDKDYRHYLQRMNGTCFFCYNNRKSSVAFARDVIVPKLNPAIEVIFVEGREVKNRSDSKFISRMLYSIQERKGFPYLLKIEDEQVLNYSVNNQFYSTMIGKKQVEPLLAHIDSFFISNSPSSN